MKVYLFLAFSILYASIKAQSLVVAADKMNVFYLGVDNPIDVAVEGVANEKLKVSTDNGEVILQKQGKYIVHPENAGFGNIIIEWNGQRVLKGFRVKPIPNPEIDIRSARPEGHLSSFKNSLKSFFGLTALLYDFDFDAKCWIVSYTCICSFSNGEVKKIEVKGSTSDEVIEWVRKLKEGDTLSFTRIYTMCPGDKIPRLSKFEISRTIK